MMMQINTELKKNNRVNHIIVVSKIDENRCKQKPASLPCFGAYR